MKKSLSYVALISCVLCSMFCVIKIGAIDMQSPRFQIQWGNVNIGAKSQTSDSYNLTTTLGQLAAGEFQSAGYIVKAGFQYIYSIIPFTFSISNTNIDFGELQASTPKTVTTNLTVSFGGAGEYLVTAVEEGTLRTMLGNSIVDTSCDGGASTCSENLAKPWTSSSAYGFGYNMTGQDIPADFIDSTYFRPFPDRTVPESAATVMSSTNVGKSRQSTVAFKVNVSPIQPAGTYQTVINFVATPSY